MGAVTSVRCHPEAGLEGSENFVWSRLHQGHDFHEALTYRWREEVAEKIQSGENDYPVAIARGGSPMEAPLWDYQTAGAAHHLRGAGGGCS